MALLCILPAIRVTMIRAMKKIDIGDGGDPAMLQTIRVHGNAAENVSLAIVLMALIEIVGAPVAAIHVFGVGLLVARGLHAWGLAGNTGASFGRIIGMTQTWLVIGLAALYGIYLFSVGGRA